jgi:hypothetical protein
MQHYKDLDNKIHVLDDIKFIHLLPEGCAEITETEADAIRQAEIDAMPVVIPQVVSMRQARLALLSIGKLSIVEEAITDPAARIEWDYAATVKREHMLIAAIQPLLGMSDTEVDELFVMAAGL